MKVTSNSSIPVYTIAGASTARPLPEWLARKRKRSLKNDPEYSNRIELLQDFEFEEASSCIRVSDDGQWIMSTGLQATHVRMFVLQIPTGLTLSTGTYKPQIHTHYLPHLSLSFARHTTSLNETFILLSSDYSKSLHLQSDRSLEFHTPQGCHYTTRIPRYGRDLEYDRRAAEVIIPAVGVGEDGYGEVFRLNLEVGRFMRSYAVDVGGDDLRSAGAGSMQGGINTGSVNAASIAESSHNLMAFGTSIGTVEFWDSRSAARVGLLAGNPAITALEFQASGLNVAVGDSEGIVQLFDLRNPVPVLRKEHGNDTPIQTLIFLNSSSAEDKILSADKKSIKIWDQATGKPWTSVEPVVDINCVAHCKDSGMILTANEGREQHAFFIPQLGPAPKWCSFLDSIVEEMAEDSKDPLVYQSSGAVYDNFKFLSIAELRNLNLEHLIGTTNLLRPYMHGFFVAQKLYEEARLIANPFVWEEHRAKKIKDSIGKIRESRIRGNKKTETLKVNKQLAEKIMNRQKKHGQEGQADLLEDSRFTSLFQNEEFAIDEYSREFASLNPSTKPSVGTEKKRTAVEDEAEDDPNNRAESTDDESDGFNDGQKQAPSSQMISTASYRKSGHKPQMRMSSSTSRSTKDRAFGSQKPRPAKRNARFANVTGERQITFAPEPKTKSTSENLDKRQDKPWKDRRSASGNTFRNM
ncbi:MAG: hypothetical protein M1814_003468 [Vezdaea aestivalis]|nr:MAG: hypothetical protein M1814_003468 [Vezdaea aestivalis]